MNLRKSTNDLTKDDESKYSGEPIGKDIKINLDNLILIDEKL